LPAKGLRNAVGGFQRLLRKFSQSVRSRLLGGAQGHVGRPALCHVRIRRAAGRLGGIEIYMGIGRRRPLRQVVNAFSERSRLGRVAQTWPSALGQALL
jgi:hypothetical protein